jgi:hypothetical protein
VTCAGAEMHVQGHLGMGWPLEIEPEVVAGDAGLIPVESRILKLQSVEVLSPGHLR